MSDPIIKIKRSNVAGKIPTPAQVPLGEIALNTFDGKLYASKNVGIGTTVITINPWSVGTGTDVYDTYFTAGNVGIGSTLPSSKLSVVGDANFSGVVTASAFYGDGSGLSGIVTSRGIAIESNNELIGTEITSLNFIGVGNTFSLNGSELNITLNDTLPISTRQGLETINLVGAGFTVSLRSGIGTVNF